MNNNFAENLRKIRKDNNLSQEQLAEELGVSRQAISKWESSAAYPEMDKIISLCNKFNLNIDDLLHKDIRELKGEEETRKKVNKYIDDFLKFITDTVSLFTNMSFKSKMKCLFEQALIIFILFMLSLVVLALGNYIMDTLFGFLPLNISNFIVSILGCVFKVFIIILCVIIVVHIFKTRYLDYYDKIKNSKVEDEEKNDEAVLTYKDNKILFKKNEDKIIIRDPDHTEYRFINGLLKCIVGIIKFFAICFSLFLCFILVSLFCGFILSFLVYKTGFFFIGLLISVLSASVIDVIFLLIIFNFVFNRKNDKKKMIWSFIGSIVALGIGLGCTFIGSLNFDVLDTDKSMLKEETIEFEMKDNTFFNYYGNINYNESDISNIKVEYKINKYCTLENNLSDEHGIHFYSNCPQPTKMVREFIKNINDKKIIPIDSEVKDITVYASKENIQKLKSNKDNNITNSYEKHIDDLNREIEKKEEENRQLQNQIYDLEDKINNYKSKIDE